MGKTGYLTENEIYQILSTCGISKEDIPYFVETGTYHGDSTREAAKVFENVHTIEIMDDLWSENVSTNKELGIDNIECHHGDSLVTLPSIVKSIDKPCFWFLDAHQSGPDTGNNGEWVPLLKELDIILGNKVEGIFVIDDVRLFSKHWDWAAVSLESISNLFGKHGYDVSESYLMNDRYILSAKETPLKECLVQTK